MVKWLKQYTTEQWLKPVINQTKVKKGYRKRNGVIMFPTTHDITPLNINECMEILSKLLEAGNKVLVVSKPHWKCVTLICENFQQYRDQLLFRFTIGSFNDSVLNFWEPGATCFGERQACLQYAFTTRYSTSVSCEPFLDENVIGLYCRLKNWITHSFWIGLLRDFKNRVDLSKISMHEKKIYVEPLLATQTKDEIIKLYKALKNEQLIKWKDSIREAIGLGD